MIMRITIFVLFPFYLFSQVNITFYNEDKIGVSNLVVVIDGLNKVTDTNGDISVKLKDKLIHIHTSHVAYVDLDTMLYINPDVGHYDLKLISKAYDLKEASVSYKKTIEEPKKWIVYDVELYNDTILVLGKIKKQNFIYLFDNNGLFLNKKKVGDFKKLERIFQTDNILLYNNIKGEEYNMVSGNVVQKNKIDYYIKYYFPYVLNYGEKLMIKSKSCFNQKIRYSLYDKLLKQKLSFQYEIFDTLKYEHSRSEYQGVISLYYKIMAENNKTDIDFGSPKNNIIESGLWSGDLKDLIVNNEIFKKVAYWYAIDNTILSHDDYVKEGKLYILDGLNNLFIEIDVETGVQKKIPIDDKWHGFKFIDSNSKQNIYFGSENDLYFYNIKSTEFGRVKYDDSKLPDYNKKVILDDSIFILGHSYGKNKKDIIIRKIQ